MLSFKIITVSTTYVLHGPEHDWLVIGATDKSNCSFFICKQRDTWKETGEHTDCALFFPSFSLGDLFMHYNRTYILYHFHILLILLLTCFPDLRHQLVARAPREHRVHAAAHVLQQCTWQACLCLLYAVVGVINCNSFCQHKCSDWFSYTWTVQCRDLKVLSTLWQLLMQHL